MPTRTTTFLLATWAAGLLGFTSPARADTVVYRGTSVVLEWTPACSSSDKEPTTPFVVAFDLDPSTRRVRSGVLGGPMNVPRALTVVDGRLRTQAPPLWLDTLDPDPFGPDPEAVGRPSLAFEHKVVPPAGNKSCMATSTRYELVREDAGADRIAADLRRALALRKAYLPLSKRERERPVVDPDGLYEELRAFEREAADVPYTQSLRLASMRARAIFGRSTRLGAAAVVAAFQEMQAFSRDAYGPAHLNTLFAGAMLGAELVRQGEVDRGLQQLRDALETSDREHGQASWANGNLSMIFVEALHRAGRLDRRGRELLDRIVDMELRVKAEDSGAAAWALLSAAAQVARENRELARAARFSAAMLERTKRKLGPESVDALQDQLTHAGDALNAGDALRADALAREVRDAGTQRYGATHAVVLRARGYEASRLLEAGDFDGAFRLQRGILEDLERASVRNPLAIANTQAAMAGILHRLGRNDEALVLLRVALAPLEKAYGPLDRQVMGDRRILAGVLVELGQLEEARSLLEDLQARIPASGGFTTACAWRRYFDRAGLPELAIAYGKLCIQTILEVQRSNADAQAGQRRLRDRSSREYTALADLLVSAGRLPEAQQVLALLKEDEQLEFTRGDPKAGGDRAVELAPYEQALLDQYRLRTARIAKTGAELEALRGKAKQGLSETEAQRRTTLESELQEANREFRAYLDRLLAQFAKADPIRSQEIGEKNLRSLKAFQGTLRELGSGVVALHYLVSDARLSIIVTTPTVQVIRQADIGAAELNRRIMALREALRLPGRDPLPASRALHEVVLAPVAADLREAGATMVMASLDGALRYVPFAALHDGEKYFVERYAVAILTEAAKTSLKDRPARAWTVGGLGVTREHPGFTALPSVKAELASIVKAGGAGLLPGEVKLDEAFDGAAMKEVVGRQYPVIHIASHFVFSPGTEENSFLLLGDGTHLSLRDMKESDIDLNGVELLALSACDTATGGGRDATGREVEGFGALAQRQGAKSVIATLWPVADESTGRLMVDFYRRRQEDSLTKAQALRGAQLAFLQGPPRERHPFYWAPFILMGNWL